MGYLDRAKLLGHDVAKLQGGAVIRSKVAVNSLEQFKSIFAAGLSAEQRAKFTAQSPSWQTAAGDTEKAMNRIADHVFGTAPLSAADAAYAERIFPVKVTAVSGGTVTVNTSEIYGPSTGPVFINAGTLVFNNGSISAVGVSATIAADTLQIQSATGIPYLVSFLGQSGAAGANGTNGPAYVPAQAPNGANSSGGSPGVCTGASDGGPGTNGQAGNPGGPGGAGGAGGMSQPATISIGAYNGSATNLPFTVFAQGGSGGQGGAGGNGGSGQSGGNGGNGCANGCEGTDGGNGGSGGIGGAGGVGGPGGSGANCAPVAISFPSSAKAFLITTSNPAFAGQGGAGGIGGAGGGGGNGGGSGKHHSDGQNGNGGQPGNAGSSGAPGQSQGAPANFNIVYIPAPSP